MKYLNTDLMEKVVTFNGTKALRKDCRFIKGNYYLKHVQCFLIDDTWYRINSGYVVYDHEKQKWTLRDSDSIIYGVVDMSDPKNPTLGHFTPSKKNEYFYTGGGIYPILSLKLLESISTIKEGMNGYYYNSQDRNIPEELRIKVTPRKDGFYKYPFHYGSDDLIPPFLKTFLKEFKGTELRSDAWKHLHGYTYGVEFETSKGAIPEKYLESHGLIPCRDGSITGFEYATVPLQGEMGIQAIKAQSELLKRFCMCSINESTHIHVGGYPRTRKAIAAMFRLGLLLEKDVYAMFPYYYANTAKFKRKSYCGPLPKVGLTERTPSQIFGELFLWLSNGVKCGTGLPTGPHPMDRNNDHKWDISPRYVWCNTIPIVWGGRGTIEFRCHTPTLDSTKIINWLFIVVAILRYAKKHATDLVSKPFDELEKVKLCDLIAEMYPKEISIVLCKYIIERTTHFSNKYDSVGEDEIVGENGGTEIFNLVPIV